MRRTMKKAVAVGLAAATAFSLCACGGGDGSKGGSSKDALEVVIWDNNQQKAYIGLSAYAADYGYVEKFVDYMVELGIQSGGAGCR